MIPDVVEKSFRLKEKQFSFTPRVCVYVCGCNNWFWFRLGFK